MTYVDIETGIKCSITKLNVSIENSYLVVDDNIKRKFLTNLCAHFPWLEEKRSIQSMFNEWKTHNVLYKWHYKRDHTATVDIETNITRFYYILYNVFATLFGWLE